MKEKNRWLIALSAVAIHLSIGSAYAYSVYVKPLETLGWQKTEVSLAFTIAIFFLGISAAAFGQFVEKQGPRKSALLAATLFTSGILGSGLAVLLESLLLFYLTFGVLGGMGLGLGYISPVSTLVKWFPDRRGLATGMAVLGFGAGALITAPIAERLIVNIGVSNTFFTLGVAYFILMFLGASYIAKPPEGWVPKGMEPGTVSGGKYDIKGTQDLAQLTAKEAAKTKRFWLLWVMMFINISTGLMLISVASPMAQEKVGMTTVAAASMVALMGLFNGAGRIAWSSASDFIGRHRIYAIFFSIQLVAFLILPNIENVLMFQILIFIVLTIYGGGFAALPAFIGDLFGTKQLGAIHGLILTSWSMAGVMGPLLVAYIRDTTNSYNATFYVFLIFLAIGLMTSFLMMRDIKRIKAIKELKVQKAS
jgi:MFS transporter, OFA family, oxalate/formate antiporter